MAGSAGFAPSEARPNPLFLRPQGRGWIGRIRTCECWDQNPVPYHLATIQSPLFYHILSKNAIIIS